MRNGRKLLIVIRLAERNLESADTRFSDQLTPNYVIIDLYFGKTEDAVKMLASLNVLWRKVEGAIMTGPKARILEIVESRDL